MAKRKSETAIEAAEVVETAEVAEVKAPVETLEAGSVICDNCNTRFNGIPGAGLQFCDNCK